MQKPAREQEDDSQKSIEDFTREAMDELHTESRAEDFYRALAAPEKKKSKYFRTSKKEVERALREGKKIPIEAKNLILQRSLNRKTRVVGNIEFAFGNVSYKEEQPNKKRTLRLNRRGNPEASEEKQEVTEAATPVQEEKQEVTEAATPVQEEKQDVAEEVTAVSEVKQEKTEERIPDNVFSMMIGEDMEVVDITRVSDGEKLLGDSDVEGISKVIVVIAQESLIPKVAHANLSIRENPRTEEKRTDEAPRVTTKPPVAENDQPGEENRKKESEPNIEEDSGR